MTSYNATIELNLRCDTLSPDTLDPIMDRFIDWHPAIGVSSLGRAELIITLTAETFAQATTITAALTHDLDLVRTTIETTSDFDKRSLATIPELMSVTQVAHALGLTRASVQKRITTGQIPATRIGTTWAIPAAAI